uniref:Uncharacterized protein n=1 Tax=Parascaris equorum TaxID=6256 RepID=A0A914RWQ4_PAREQ
MCEIETTAGLNSGDDDDLSSVYSHPSMLDGGLLGGRRRISRDLYPGGNTTNDSYVSKLVQCESHASDISYEAIFELFVAETLGYAVEYFFFRSCDYS